MRRIISPLLGIARILAQGIAERAFKSFISMINLLSENELPEVILMRYLPACCGLLVLMLAAVGGGPFEMPALGQTTNNVMSVEAQQSLIAGYCAGCHNDKLKSGNFSWTAVDLVRPGHTAELSEKVIRKIRSGMMPPPGSRRPDRAALSAFAAGLETRIDQAAAKQPNVDAPELHRMNRTEYQNAVRDLLGIDVDVSELLPPDARTSGFDNMSNALTITPTLMSAYVRAAEKVSRDALGDPKATPGQVTYRVSRVANQMRQIPGAPFGTRGGISVMHTFPADGEYTFKATFVYYPTEVIVGGSLPVELQGQEIEFSVDGERVAALKIDPAVRERNADYVTPPVKIRSGERRLTAAFVSLFDGPVQDHYRLVEQTILDTSIAVTPEMTGLPHLYTLDVTGPYNATGVSESASRKRVFTCRPASSGGVGGPADGPSRRPEGRTGSRPAGGPDAKQEDEKRCATQIVMKLASEAFRRHATAEDLEGLMSYYEYGRKKDNFDEGIRAAIQAILAKPEFIFRFEEQPASVTPGQNYRITDLELASRLSYFLWSTIPDQQLINLATEGKLKQPAVLEQQVKRMLADARSEALATNFAGQWLRLGRLNDVVPDALLFPNYTKTLGDSMRREIELLFDSIMRDERSVLDLLTADYTFVDEVLAKHYGIPDILGTRFKRVQLTDPNRFGLIGKAGIMTMTSLANRTSPVARGKYVLEVLLGSPPPTPPPVVPPLKEIASNAKILTVRERMESHRANGVCAACHKIMDPIGLSLENFDAVGAWRRTDGGISIDPSGVMFDGSRLDGPVTLREAVLSRSDAFLTTFTENLFAYGLGRVLKVEDMPTVRAIARDAARNDDRVSAFVLAIVKSAPFQMRVAAGSSTAAGR